MVTRNGHNEPFPPLTTWPATTLLSTLAFSQILRPAQGCVATVPSAFVATAPFPWSCPPPLWSWLTGHFCGFRRPQSQQGSLSLPSGQPVGPFPELSPTTAILHLLSMHLLPGRSFQEEGTGLQRPEGTSRCSANVYLLKIQPL